MLRRMVWVLWEWGQEQVEEWDFVFQGNYGIRRGPIGFGYGREWKIYFLRDYEISPEEEKSI